MAEKGKREKQSPSSKKNGGHKSSSTSASNPLKTTEVMPGVKRPSYIAGIGSSSGGLEALNQFFSNMPSDSGISFVLVSHLDPSYKSIMAELVKKYTQMNVFQAEDDMEVLPDSIYIIPPNKDLAILHRRLQLLEPQERRGLRHPIDSFFRSLAEDAGDAAIGIILSGAGTDGTNGLRAVKAEGGMVMVQDAKSAKYDGMPRSALDTGLADFILPPEKMPEHLVKYIRHFHIAGAPIPEILNKNISDNLQKIMLLIRKQTGHDFSGYKQNTVMRRIERRMNIHQIKDVRDYTHYLQQNAAEAELLFREFLIGVTSFFRDPEAFDALKGKALPRLFEGIPPQQTLRVWVPGCSTGEEAFSVAIVIKEYLDKEKLSMDLQVFATDIDKFAIDKARAGTYPDSIAADLSEERLARFFIKSDNTYQIKKEIREMVVFALQDVLKDPPFSRLDIVSCRNLLIYLNPETQKNLIPQFHYVLNPGGVLFLGSSETLGQFSELFAVLDKKWKLFAKKTDASGLPLKPLTKGFPDYYLRGVTEVQRTGVAGKGSEPGLGELTERLLLDSFSPPCVVIDRKHNILYIHGKTGRYLEPAQGVAGMNIIEMAREGLRNDLVTAIHAAGSGNKSVIKEGLHLNVNGAIHSVDIEVRPLLKPEQLNGLLMVVFREPRVQGKAVKASITARGPVKRIEDLENELLITKEYLNSTIEELERTNEELQATNEEMQSSNEELQSTNEELETSKEELQSVNEELITVNSELQGKIEELSNANNDLNNLLVNTDIATIFLDNNLCIRRFTPVATRMISLIEADIGRPIEQIATNLTYEHFVEDIKGVLKTLVFRETEVQTKKGLWYAMRIMPYRTTENMIDGAVITFTDISAMKDALLAARHSADFAEAIVKTVREPVVILDEGLRVVSVNPAFCQTFRSRPEETEGKFIYEIDGRQWDIPALRKLLEGILSKDIEFIDFKVKQTFRDIGQKTMLLNARKLFQKSGEAGRILLAIEDITERPEPEERLLNTDKGLKKKG